MKKFLYNVILAVTVLAVVVLVGIAVGISILRPDANYVSPDGLPTSSIPDYGRSAIFLAAAAPACFVGSFFMRFLNYDDPKGR